MISMKMMMRWRMVMMMRVSGHYHIDRGSSRVGAVIREDAVPALNVSWDQHMMMMINYPP